MPIDYTKRPATPPPDDPPPVPAATPQPPAAHAPQGAPAQPAGAPGPGVSLSKVTLTKAAPSVSLTKHGGNTGVLHVNLNWNAKPPSRGLFHRSTPLDLDLGCLYEFTDGTRGVVQALGNAFTARARVPGAPVVIWLDGDDRSGASSAGENLFVDLGQLPLLRRVLVFAFIYEGAANWAEAAGVLTIEPVGAPPIEVRLDEPRDGARTCAVAMLTNVDGTLQITREVRYVDGAQRKLDEAYGWGMKWTAGHK